MARKETFVYVVTFVVACARIFKRQEYVTGKRAKAEERQGGFNLDGRHQKVEMGRNLVTGRARSARVMVAPLTHGPYALPGLSFIFLSNIFLKNTFLFIKYF